jgi:hypothetical protein
MGHVPPSSLWPHCAAHGYAIGDGDDGIKRVTLP